MNCTIFANLICGAQEMLIDVCHTQECDQRRPKFSFHRDESFISKKRVSIDFFGPTETTLYFAQNLSKYIVKPHMLFLRFVIFDITRKGRSKSFVTVTIAFFGLFVSNYFLGLIETIPNLHDK